VADTLARVERDDEAACARAGQRGPHELVQRIRRVIGAGRTR